MFSHGEELVIAAPVSLNMASGFALSKAEIISRVTFRKPSPLIAEKPPNCGVSHLKSNEAISAPVLLKYGGLTRGSEKLHPELESHVTMVLPFQLDDPVPPLTPMAGSMPSARAAVPTNAKAAPEMSNLVIFILSLVVLCSRKVVDAVLRLTPRLTDLPRRYKPCKRVPKGDWLVWRNK